MAPASTSLLSLYVFHAFFYVLLFSSLFFIPPVWVVGEPAMYSSLFLRRKADAIRVGGELCY